MPIMSLQQPGVTGNIGEGGSGAANVTANGENTPHAAVRRFRDIARLVSDWIWETDENFQLVFTSQRIMETLGYHPLELKGRTLSELGSFLSEDRKPIYLRWKKPLPQHSLRHRGQDRHAALPSDQRGSGLRRRNRALHRGARHGA